MGLDRLAGVEAGQDTIGGVVDHVDEDHRLAAALDPFMDGGVHLDQLTETGAACPASAVGVAALAWLPESFLNEPATERLPAEVQPVFGQFLAGESWAEVVEVSTVGT
jgi:hypothetical protein